MTFTRRAGLADLEHRGAHAFVGMVRFAGDLFAAGQNGLDVGQRHGRRAAFVALHDAGDHLADQFVVLVVKRIALRLADFLDHHLFSGLRADSPDGLFRVQWSAVMRAADRTVFAVDVNDDVLVFTVLLLGRRHQGRLDGPEYDFLFHILIAMDRIHDPQ